MAGRDVTRRILLVHSRSGLSRTGYYGFNWMSLLLGGVPALLRGDIRYGLAVSAGALAAALLVGSMGTGRWGMAIGWLVAGALWGSIYNRLYTTRLLGRGYRLAGTDEENSRALRALGIDGLKTEQAPAESAVEIATLVR
jgi:hypothetical protein